MGKYLLAICIFCTIACACNDDENLPKITPTASGEFTDERDGNTYGWIRVGNLEWMTSNLKYGTPYYENEYGGPFADWNGTPQKVKCQEAIFDYEKDYETNGNLYTWEEASTLCPQGWRLPTDEDWQQLEMALGMSAKEANEEGWRGENVATLLKEGNDGLGMNLQLSGCAWQSGSYGFTIYLTNINEFGYFWTATEKKDSGLSVQTVYFRKIFATYSTVYRYTSPLDILMRVRCVRNAQQ